MHLHLAGRKDDRSYETVDGHEDVFGLNSKYSTISPNFLLPFITIKWYNTQDCVKKSLKNLERNEHHGQQE